MPLTAFAELEMLADGTPQIVQIQPGPGAAGPISIRQGPRCLGQTLPQPEQPRRPIMTQRPKILLTLMTSRPTCKPVRALASEYDLHIANAGAQGLKLAQGLLPT